MQNIKRILHKKYLLKVCGNLLYFTSKFIIDELCYLSLVLSISCFSYRNLFSFFIVFWLRPTQGLMILIFSDCIISCHSPKSQPILSIECVLSLVVFKSHTRRLYG